MVAAGGSIRAPAQFGLGHPGSIGGANISHDSAATPSGSWLLERLALPSPAELVMASKWGLDSVVPCTGDFCWFRERRSHGARCGRSMRSIQRDGNNRDSVTDSVRWDGP
jgi:hypothetical protein